MPRILFLLLLLLASLIAGAQPEPSVQLKQIDKDVWVHTSYKNYNGSLVGSNGLVVQTKQGLVLIDTPWDDDQTKALIQELAKQFPKDKVTMALITHAHEDRIGGIRTLLKNGTRVLSSSHTAKLARQQGY
ncbi:MAG: MBL fold metallo-hydrolase, partial [Hymenobacteraceae bacterium]|nr:MBL fold metallo-hydrolase [Hymenobacteraceae bacterium]